MTRPLHNPDHDFCVFAPLKTFTKSDGGEPKMWVGGIVSTDDLDQQDEVVVADGLDFKSVFLARGWFNDNHKQGTTDVLGYPTDAIRVKPGDALPDGGVSDVNGWWAEGYLLETEKGRAVHELCHALQGTPRQLGFSIEGKITQRGKNTVKSAVVHNVAITHCPVQTRSYMVALAKALTAGTAVASGDMNQGPGDGSALRTESLDGLSPEDLDDKDKRKKMADDLIGATAFPEHVLLGKATGQPVRIARVAEVERWGDALAANVLNMGDREEVRLSKAEADIVARTLYANLPRDKRETLIKNLTGGL